MLQTKTNVHPFCPPCSPHRQDKVKEQLSRISWKTVRRRHGQTTDGVYSCLFYSVLWREQTSASEELKQSITLTSASLGRLDGVIQLVWVGGQNLSISNPLDEKGDFMCFAVFNQMEKHAYRFPPGTYGKKNVKYVECDKVMLITYLVTVIMRIK